MKHLLQCHPIAPVEIARAQGDSLYDRSGKRYIDFEAGIWCNALGHNHPRIVACLHRQADAVMHLGPLFSGSLTETAAAALLRHTPHPEGKVTFLSAGSEAVEVGIRVARKVTGRRRLLTLGKSYLGAYGESNQESSEVWTKVDLMPCLTCPLTECSARCPNLSHVEPEQVAAFVFEPVLASGGIIVVPPKLVRLLTSLVQGAGGLVVVDEVTTGFGRTGTWWGFEQHGITPDIIACGKSLGNGYPVSAVVVSPTVAEAAERSEFRHSQSHQNDPLAAAIALEVVRVFEAERVLELVPAASAALESALRGLSSPLVADVRGLGLMYGLELRPGLVDVVWERMLHRGFMIGFKTPISLLRFLPPLITPPAAFAAMGAALREVIEELE